MKNSNTEYKGNIKISVFVEILIYFLIGTVVIGFVSWVILATASTQTVLNQKNMQAENIFDDLDGYFAQYRSMDYVFEYWIKNMDSMEVEYDTNEISAAKNHEFNLRNPGFIFNSASTDDIEALSEEDRKFYAEVIYNRCVMRLNMIRKAFDIEYIYCLAADEKFENAIYLLSGSDGSRPRSSKFGDFYTLGTTIKLDEKQKNTLMDTLSNSYHMAESVGFVDRYETLTDINGYHIFLGLTYSTFAVQHEIADQTRHGALFTVLFMLIFAAISLSLIRNYVLVPLKEVQSNVENYMINKDSEEVVKRLTKIKQRDEIGMLAHSFSNMALTIDSYIDEVQKVTADKERIDTELNVATRIQENMLPCDFPPFPDRKEFDIYAKMDPAKEVGGDFYDFFFVDDDHLAIVIADVSGKGVPAALFMVIAKTLLKIRTQSNRGTPADILYDVNNTLCSGNKVEMFVTVWLAVINLKTGEGIAANAGHEHPILRHKDGQFEPVMYKHSHPLGMLENAKFREHEFTLMPGDSVFVYTDGVTEAENTEHELFGMDRCVTALNKCTSNDPETLIKTVRKDIDEFVGEADQFDDITMLSYFYKGDK
ncbi:SpoIIE family protein phosphatase [Butyrivibrio sp. XPD2002]|uniref:SpoIIE family protein phosphatase n=1 Tax=Butyrivibrio sp. XPD2002 TaxID=1280665 RepID=UPI00042A096F|nr:PP2C family protein-serine/threonine phosphatase [Butyrivibrio sp. XPD2002]